MRFLPEFWFNDVKIFNPSEPQVLEGFKRVLQQRQVPGSVPGTMDDLGQAHVRQLDPPLIRQQQVLWLQISEDNPDSGLVRRMAGHGGWGVSGWLALSGKGGWGISGQIL